MSKSTPKLNVLVAYPYVTKEILTGIREMGDRCRWLLDSGAFTAFKAGKVIRVDDYCRFLESLPVTPWRYFALDVIGNPKETLRNYEAMRARGFAPIPVFTRGESLSVLDEYFKTSDVVGIGGVAAADKSAYSFAKRVMEYADGRQIHILGFTSMDWVKFLRPYSVDSSAWESGARYGTVQVYLGSGKFGSVRRADVSHKPPSPAIARAISRFGFDPMRLQKRDDWHGNDSLARWIPATSWVAASVDIERNLGTKLFLALAANRFDMLKAGLSIVTDDTPGETFRQKALSLAKRKVAA